MKDKKREALKHINKAIESLFRIKDVEKERDDLCDVRFKIENTMNKLSTGEVTKGEK